MKDVAKRFSVRYFLHLKLIDEDERTYYKQQEIQLWRKPDKSMGLNVYMFNSQKGAGGAGDNVNNDNNGLDDGDDYNGEEAAL